LGTASLCANAGTLRLQVDKSPRLQGSVQVLDGRWRVDWDSLEPSARVWLQPVRDNGVAQLRLQPIDPSIDFSYDFQDVALERIGDCAAPAPLGEARARRWAATALTLCSPVRWQTHEPAPAFRPAWLA